jgi:hypothetical protein
MATLILALAGLRIPFKVILGSPMVGVFVIFKDKEEAAVALSMPSKIKLKAKSIVSAFFTS